VQHAFTALLASTSAPVTPSVTAAAAAAAATPASRRPPSQSRPPLQSEASAAAASALNNSVSFLRILRAFLARAAASSPTIADLRAVLQSVFSAYAYEENILQLSSRLLDKSLFTNMQGAVELRQRGWRPRGSACEACGRRVWGPGLQGNVLGAWEESVAREEQRRRQTRGMPGLATGDKGKAAEAEPASSLQRSRTTGKGKDKDTERSDAAAAAADHASEEPAAGDSLGKAAEGDALADEPKVLHGMRNGKPVLEPLVVFACRHIYHRSCLEAMQAGNERMLDVGEREGGYRCPIDG
jgi:hypothetical protein